MAKEIKRGNERELGTHKERQRRSKGVTQSQRQQQSTTYDHQNGDLGVYLDQMINESQQRCNIFNSCNTRQRLALLVLLNTHRLSTPSALINRWSTLVNAGQRWSTLVNDSQRWSTLIGTGHTDQGIQQVNIFCL